VLASPNGAGLSSRWPVRGSANGAAQLSRADEGTIYEYDETEEVFVLKSAFGMSAERVAALRERRVRLGETHLGRAAVERAPVHVDDAQQDPTLSGADRGGFPYRFESGSLR
jgi:hypothetical protein